MTEPAAAAAAGVDLPSPLEAAVLTKPPDPGLRSAAAALGVLPGVASLPAAAAVGVPDAGRFPVEPVAPVAGVVLPTAAAAAGVLAEGGLLLFDGPATLSVACGLPLEDTGLLLPAAPLLPPVGTAAPADAGLLLLPPAGPPLPLT